LYSGVRLIYLQSADRSHLQMLDHMNENSKLPYFSVTLQADT